jgi:2-keto-4-pentenoate hydratase/2-oxohepta-3-ene-1,7-dioic acid hydratase in catechol pathway
VVSARVVALSTQSSIVPQVVMPSVVFCADDNYRCQPRPRRAGLALQRPAALSQFLTGEPIEDVLIVAVDPRAVSVGETDVIIPRACERLDVGVSLVAVIGQADGPGIVEYCVALDFVRRDVPAPQAYLARSFPTHKVLAATRVTVDQRAKLGDLALEMSVDGAIRQRSTTAQMIADPVALVDTISPRFRLRPGDLVFTGTPAGTAIDLGTGWLVAGNVVEGRIPGIGTVIARLVDEGDA